MKADKQKKQAVLLYASSLGGVALGVLASIVNTRFLAPSDYGDVRYVQNIINFIASLLLFGYFMTGGRMLALANNSRYCRQIKGVMVIILMLAGLVLCTSVLGCSLLHDSKPQVAFLFLVSLPVCLCPLLMNYIEQTAEGDNQIGRLSLARLLPYLLYAPTAYVVYKYFGATSTRMILLQWGIYTSIYIAIIISTRPLFRGLAPAWKQMREENRDYGIQLYIGSLIMVATNYLAGISLGYFNAENSEVGFYTLALTVTSPLATLPKIVGTTYFKRFATQPCIPGRIILFTIGMTICTCIAFLLLIQYVVVFLYSERYAVVGIYASYLSVGYCLHGLGDMFNRYLGSHGQGRSIRNASIINGIFKIFGFTVLVAFFNTNGAIATAIICDIIYFVCLVYYYNRFVKQNAYERV